MKIGILAAGISPEGLCEKYGSYAGMFEDLLGAIDDSIEFEKYIVREGQFPEQIADIDGWIITGSRCGVYDELPWMEQLKSLILEIYEWDQPLVGICFGHQIVASAFGAEVKKFSGGWGLGPTYYELTDDHPTLDKDAANFCINAVHQDQVMELPRDATLLARSEFCAYAGLRYGNRILTLQAHPEFNNDFTRELISSRRGTSMDAERVDQALVELDTHQVEQQRVGQWLYRFLRRDYLKES